MYRYMARCSLQDSLLPVLLPLVLLVTEVQPCGVPVVLWGQEPLNTAVSHCQLRSEGLGPAGMISKTAVELSARRELLLCGTIGRIRASALLHLAFVCHVVLLKHSFLRQRIT